MSGGSASDGNDISSRANDPLLAMEYLKLFNAASRLPPEVRLLLFIFIRKKEIFYISVSAMSGYAQSQGGIQRETLAPL